MVPPENLLYLADALTKDADDAATIHAFLCNAIATNRASSVDYYDDVCVVLCEAAKFAGGQTVPLTLPPLEYGASATFSSLLDVHASLTNKKTLLERSFVAHTCRRNAVLKDVVCGVGAPVSVADESVSEKIAHILIAFGSECQFKRTRDKYLHSLIALRLPAWAAAPITTDHSPFPAASEMMRSDANDTLRPLIEIDVGNEMALVEKGKPHTADTLCMAAVLLEELLGGSFFFVNDNASLLPDPMSPRLCAITTLGDTMVEEQWGVVYNKEMHEATSVYDAVAEWLEHTVDPLAAPLRNAVRGVELGGNVVAKYLPSK